MHVRFWMARDASAHVQVLSVVAQQVLEIQQARPSLQKQILAGPAHEHCLSPCMPLCIVHLHCLQTHYTT